MQLREAWLEQVASFLRTYLEAHGLFLGQSVRVSCGWPSRGGLVPRLRVVGQCFPSAACEDGRPQIFVSPRVAESVDVLGILLHELIQVVVGCKHGHGKKFSQAAGKVGLGKPWVATTVGDALRPKLEAFVAEYGPYPHAAILCKPKGLTGNGDYPHAVLPLRPGSRLCLYECRCSPPIKVRVASDSLQAQCLLCENLFCLVTPGNEERRESIT